MVRSQKLEGPRLVLPDGPLGVLVPDARDVPEVAALLERVDEADDGVLAVAAADRVDAVLVDELGHHRHVGAAAQRHDVGLELLHLAVEPEHRVVHAGGEGVGHDVRVELLELLLEVRVRQEDHPRLVPRTLEGSGQVHDAERFLREERTEEEDSHHVGSSWLWGG